VVNARETPVHTSDLSLPLGAQDTGHAVAFQQNTRDEVRLIGGDGQIAGALAAEPGMKQQNYVASPAVRRLTPVECERLQGFPDGYTAIPWRGKAPEGCPDGPRYKALGNSMAVPVMRWIGERIAAVDATQRPLA
jgi:DNA (cytosine-5)-methyltransferase 1